MKYKLFDPKERIEIEINLEKKKNIRVIDLLNRVFDKYNIYNKDILEFCTVYDMDNYHVVNDNRNKIKDENLSSNLCFAYYKKNEFLYVEGGWGHHMIDMDVVKEINDPIMFMISCGHVMQHKSMVSNKSFKLIDIYNALIKNNYININSPIAIYEIDYLKSNLITTLCIDDFKDKSVYELLSQYGNLYELVIKFENE